MIDLSISRLLRSTLGAADQALGLRLLSELLDSGLPIARALRVFAELAPESWRSKMPGLRRSVREGRSLASALADASLGLPQSAIGIISAGESGMGLAAALGRAAALAEVTAANRAAARAALAYPAILAAAGGGTLLIMTGIVIPRFAAILDDVGQSLPPMTQAVMNVATGVRAAFLPATFLAIALLPLVVRWAATPSGRRRCHGFLLDMPVIGDVRAAATTARAAATLGALQESGVPLAPALRLAARASGDAVVEERLLQARSLVAGGMSLSHALDRAAALTPVAIRLVRAGEASSRLAPMLFHVAKLEQQHSERVTKNALRLLEPILILLFALLVAAVAAALLQAVYGLRPIS